MFINVQQNKSGFLDYLIPIFLNDLLQKKPCSLVQTTCLVSFKFIISHAWKNASAAEVRILAVARVQPLWSTREPSMTCEAHTLVGHQKSVA